VIVAVLAIRMVQVAFDQIIDVVAVRHCFMTASRPVSVRSVVSLAGVFRGAALRVGVADCDRVLVDVALVRVVQVPVVQVVHVSFVLHRHMAAVRTVLVLVVVVNVMLVFAH
jgi:hypothetical protein